MMMQPNWFDQKLDERLVLSGANIGDKVTQALAQIVKMDGVRDSVKKAIEHHEKHPGMPGPSLSQSIRTGIADAINAAP